MAQELRVLVSLKNQSSDPHQAVPNCPQILSGSGKPDFHFWLPWASDHTWHTHFHKWKQILLVLSTFKDLDSRRLTPRRAPQAEPPPPYTEPLALQGAFFFLYTKVKTCENFPGSTLPFPAGQRAISISAVDKRKGESLSPNLVLDFSALAHFGEELLCCAGWPGSLQMFSAVSGSSVRCY